jgi:hypothetical protein
VSLVGAVGSNLSRSLSVKKWIHETSVESAGRHPAEDVTMSSRELSSERKYNSGDETENSVSGGQKPCWFTTYGWPATLIVVDRCGPVFRTTPSSQVPVEHLEVAHGTGESTENSQPERDERTLKLRFPPSTLKFAGLGRNWEIENVHVPAAWRTIKLRPPTSSCPERAKPVLVATSKEMLPLPLPRVGPLRIIQGSIPNTAQRQPGGAVTSMLRSPPLAGNSSTLCGRVTPHAPVRVTLQLSIPLAVVIAAPVLVLAM